MREGLTWVSASMPATKTEGAAGTRWTYTASGPTTNLAARLAALGEGGSVIISDETRQRLGDEFDAEDMGLQSLKNVAQPVRAYRLTAEQREPATARELVGLSERRRHPRRPGSWPVSVWIGEGSFSGHAVDASLQGICLATLAKDLLKGGMSYRVEILLDGDDPFPCTAEVRSLSDRGAEMETKEPLPLS